MNFNPVNILIIISSTITLFLAIYTWKRRAGSTNVALYLLLSAITVWSLFYGIELASTTLVQMRVFLAIQYTGITTIPVLWLIFAVRYTKYCDWLTPTRMRLLFIVPAITVVMVATNSLHFLYYSVSELGYSDGFWFHKMAPGPFYWVHIVYSYAVIFFGLLLFVRMYFNVVRTSRLNIIFFIFGALFPYAVSIAYVLGMKPFGFLDLTPLGFIVMGVVLTVGIFSVNLFNINPLALDVLFDNMPDPIFVIDNNDLIVSSNPPARELTKMKELTDREGKHGTFMNLYAHLFHGKENEKSEIEINGKYYIRSVNEISDSKGEVLVRLLVLRDISIRKNSEEALKQRERELKESNITKDKFFSIIAHDLRSPFNSILGFSDLLVEQVQQKDYEKVGEFSAIIQDSAKRAMDLLNNLMEWSSSQTGRIKFNPVFFEIGKLVEEVAMLLIDDASRKSITVLREVPDNLTVLADKSMVATVMRNLISNAVKFTPSNGTITIKVTKGEEILVSVADNGVGINKETLTKLFLIEECVSTNGTNNEKGTGLGLLLCKEFVERHGGKIWAESEVGVGSVFRFSIPDSDKQRLMV